MLILREYPERLDAKVKAAGAVGFWNALYKGSRSTFASLAAVLAVMAELESFKNDHGIRITAGVALILSTLIESIHAFNKVKELGEERSRAQNRANRRDDDHVNRLSFTDKYGGAGTAVTTGLLFQVACGSIGFFPAGKNNKIPDIVKAAMRIIAPTILPLFTSANEDGIEAEKEALKRVR